MNSAHISIFFCSPSSIRLFPFFLNLCFISPIIPSPPSSPPVSSLVQVAPSDFSSLEAIFKNIVKEKQQFVRLVVKKEDLLEMFKVITVSVIAAEACALLYLLTLTTLEV